MTKLTGMRLLVVEHNADNVELLEEVLGQAGYVDVIGTQDPEGEVDRAIAEITSQTGRQFDPLVIEAFAALDPRTLPIHDPEQ